MIGGLFNGSSALTPFLLDYPELPVRKFNSAEVKGDLKKRRLCNLV